MNSGCIHTGIDKQLVKEKKIKTEPMDRLFKVFNIDGIKNKEVTWFTSLKLEINGYKKYIDTTVIDLNSTDIFLGYKQLVKHN